jgi:hypothetical protein
MSNNGEYVRHILFEAGLFWRTRGGLEWHKLYKRHAGRLANDPNSCEKAANDLIIACTSYRITPLLARM